MIKGKTLQELATEIQRQAETKRDFGADTKNIRLEVEEGKPRFSLELKSGKELFVPRNLFHQQVGTWAKIPKAYYDKMLSESPELLQRNVNHWLENSRARRLVRTLDQEARAFLSSRYRSLDNDDLAKAILPALSEAGVEVKSCQITENRLYIQAVNPKLEGETTKGRIVQAGVCVSNSEVGLGSLKIEPLIYELVCTNGMISQDNAFRKYHVGRVQGDGGSGAWEHFQDSTRKASDRALWLQVQDLTKAALSEALFEQQIRNMKEAATIETGKPRETVELAKKRLGLSESEKDDVLEHLIKGGDLSAYGLCNAVTRTAQDSHDYDRAVELERFGGTIIANPGSFVCPN